MILVSIIFDEYIDQPKLSEQKTIWVYSSSPPPLKRGRNNKPKADNWKVFLVFAYISFPTKHWIMTRYLGNFPAKINSVTP